MTTGKSTKKTETPKGKQQLVLTIEYRIYPEELADIGSVLETMNRYGDPKIVDFRVEEVKDS